MIQYKTFVSLGIPFKLSKTQILYKMPEKWVRSKSDANDWFTFTHAVSRKVLASTIKTETVEAGKFIKTLT